MPKHMGTHATSTGLESTYDLILGKGVVPCPSRNSRSSSTATIKYVVISLVACTAQGGTHISGKELAKTVIVNIDKALATALDPASLHIDLSQLRSAAGAENVAVASEEEFKERSLDCETGGMPPFGNLYDMPGFALSSGQGDRVQCGLSSRTRATRLGRFREAS